jgi:hypothetical protein
MFDPARGGSCSGLIDFRVGHQFSFQWRPAIIELENSSSPQRISHSFFHTSGIRCIRCLTFHVLIEFVITPQITGVEQPFAPQSLLAFVRLAKRRRILSAVKCACPSSKAASFGPIRLHVACRKC